MDFKTYQQNAADTAIYPSKFGDVYTALGLAGEAGEVAEIVKKHIRDERMPGNVRDALRKELGDVLWYVAMCAREWGLDLDDIAQHNLDKLSSRKERDALSGDGDDR